MDKHTQYLIDVIEYALCFLPDLEGEDDFDTPMTALYGRAILKDAVELVRAAEELVRAAGYVPELPYWAKERRGR